MCGAYSDLPETQDDRDTVASEREPPVLYLVWQEGQVVPSACAIPAEGLFIGRDRDCAVCLDSARVSRRHVELRREGPLLTARDLASRNGTFVNGRRIDHHPIVPGDSIRVGPYVGVFVLAPAGITDWRIADVGGGLMAGPLLSLQLARVRKLAGSDLSVTIVGATGTGKERLARAIHGWSGRSGDFLAANCAAIPANLAEAELFGYRKGAFTGASYSHQGYFREADQGTLFLDEIADLSLEIQAKLLRAVEEKLIRPLGDSKQCSVNMRLITATQQPFEQLVASGRFRADLAARLSGLVFELPSLAERFTDVVPLFRYFAARHLGYEPQLEPRFVEAILLYAWPKNVREMELLVRRIALERGTECPWKLSDLPPGMRVYGSERHSTTAPLPPAGLDSLRAEVLQARRLVEVEQLAVALKSTGGNIKAAAEKLGITRQRVYRLMQAHPTNGSSHSADFRVDRLTGISHQDK